MTQARRRRGLARSKPAPIALEARLMFDGAALATATETQPQPAPDAAPAPADVHEAAPAPAAAEPSSAAREGAQAAEAAPAREVAFIDTTAPDWQTLAAAVRPGVELVLLDPAKDGLAQIADALRGRSDLDAVYVVSHGAEGALVIGGQSYTADTIAQHRAELADIGRALAADGDLLLYGCDIAEGSAGERFIDAVAQATQADVAASTNATGAAALGADWKLEASTGTIEAGLFADPSRLAAYDAELSTVSLSGNTGWIPVMIGANFDPMGDTQAGAADTDLVGDATHAALYVAFDNGGTPGTTADDSVLFRIRVGNPTSTTYFGGVAIVGIDANLDGRIDLFVAVDGRNNAQRVQLFDPGTGANNSPSTTTTSPLPAGWLADNGVYPFAASNYSVNAVSATTDPNWNGNTDLGADGHADAFVSFKIPLSDIAGVLAIPSPMDRSGVVGPRGTTGIQGFDANTPVRYVLMSQTQPGPINGDIGGVGASYDKNATFDQLGAFTAPMSMADPIPAGATLTVAEPVGDGNLSAAEDGSVTISGTSSNLADGTTVTVTISDADAGTADVTATATVTGNAWSVGGVNLSTLADGNLTVTAQATVGATITDTATVLHDRTAPVIAVTGGTAYNDTTPTISGTSDLPAGSVITVTVDPDNDAGTANSLVYTTTVGAGGAWAIDTGVVAPVSGTFPAAGLPTYGKITASGSDAAGNSTTATGLNRPTVNSLTTNDTTPTVTGTWTSLAGDTLTVSVNGVTYAAGSGLSISGNTWSVTTGTLALGTYDVIATVTRAAGGSASDAVVGELVIASGPAVTISGGASATGADTTPAISGTTTLSPGDFVLVRVDPNGDGNLSDAVTYAATVGAGGAWTIDTGTATPISGSFPASGITGPAGILVTATDANGNSVTASQTLTVTVPSIATTSIETTATANASALIITGDSKLNSREDDAVTVSGTSANAVGSTVTVTVSDGTSNVSGTATVAAGGGWSVSGLNLSSLKDGNLTVTATVLTASDSDVVTHDATAPVSYITTASTLDKTNPVLKGITDLPSGSTLTIAVTKTSDGSAVASGTTTVGADGRWTWQSPTNVIYPTGAGAVTITVSSSATDVAGNKLATVSKVQTVANNASPPSIVVTAVTGIDYSTGDSTITSAEIGGGVTISGTSSTTTGTVSVSVTDGTTTVSSTPSTNGTWSMTLTNAQVKSFKNGTLTITSTVASGGITATSMYVPTLFLVTGTPAIAVNTPIDNGILNAVEDDSVSISGTTANAVGSTVTLTVSDSDGATPDVTGTAVVANDGTWTVGGLNLSGLADGALTASASVTANSITATGAASVAHDKTAPVIAVTAGASATDTTPVISGTTDLPAGSTLTITIDPNNDGVLTDQVVYTATVQSGGAWSVDTGAATPSSGALGAGGLTSYAKITVSGTDQAGNSSTTTALNRPTVNTLTTNDTTPTLGGSWTNLGTDTLTVTVNGTTYTTGAGLSVSGNGWSLTTNALPAGTYNVVATSTRGGNTASDATASELVVDTTAPVIAVTSTALTADTTPVLSGTTDLSAGSVLTVTVDPDNDNTTSNSFTYTVIVGAGGTWSVDTGSALPTSGSFPAGGLAGDVGVRVTGTDAAGNTTTATQTLVVDVVPPAVSILTNAMTPDTTPVISGTSDLAPGATLTLKIDPNNDGDWSDAYVYTLTIGAGGAWSVDTGAVAPDGMGATVTLSGTVGLQATASDAVGNTTVTAKSLIIDTSAPALAVSAVGDGNISANEDDAVLIQGTSTDIANGSTLTIYITDGTTTITDTVTVNNNAWAMTPIDLSALADGAITVTASYVNVNGDSFTSAGTFNHDKTAPTVALTAGSSSITGPVTVTATFDEAVNGLAAGDFATSNGAAVSNLVQSNATTWTFTLTPAVNGTASVWLPASEVQDAAGNDNALSAALGFSASLGVPDTIAPTVTSIVRQTPAGSLTNADSVTFRVAFSEATLGVDSGDFALSGGAAGAASIQSVSAVSGQPGVYDVVVTGIASANGTLDLALAASPTITDAASNALTDGTPSSSNGYLLDNVAPALTSANGAVVSYSSLVLSYDENLATVAPAAADFAVVKNGATPISVTGVAVNTINNTVTLTLASAVSDTDAIAVSYTAGANRTQDLAGNVAASLVNLAVTNATPSSDTTAPAAPTLALLAGSDSGASNADRLTNIDTPTLRVGLNGTGATAPVPGDVVNVYLGATQVATATLSAGDIANGYVDVTTSTLGADGAKGLTATVTDAASNASAASSALTLTLDTAAPALSSATVNGGTLVLTYGETLAGTTPAAGDFVVSINGVSAAPSGVTLDTVAKTVTLTLSSAASNGDAVTVSYTPGGSSTQDAAGNAVAALAAQAVVNSTPDTTAPAAPALALLASSDTGQDTSDRITRDDTPTIRVTLNGAGAAAPVAGDVVKLYLGATQVGAATLGAGDIANGYIDVTTGALGADGAKSLTATVTDAANNASAASAALALTLDTAAPSLSSASVNGSTLVLTYGETLSGTTPAAFDFTVTVNGVSAAPGAVVVDANAMTVTLTLAAPVSIGDVVTVSYAPGASQTQDPAGNSAASLVGLAVNNVTGDTTPPTVASIDDGDADNLVEPGDVLVYTVTFSEDIDASTVSAADFGNGGTAGITIGAIAKTAPGVFSVQVAPTSVGSLILQVNAGAVITDAAGNALDTTSAVPDDTTVTVADLTPPAAPGLQLLAGSDSGQSSADRITNIDTPTLRVILNGSGRTAPVAGDAVRIYSGATQVGTATLSAGDVANGYVDVTTSALGADGAKSLTATVTDAASNASVASSALALTLDTTAPTLSSASVNGGTLVLTYGETLAGAPAAGDFTVSVNGVAVTPSGVTLDTVTKTVTLALSPAVSNGDAVTVSYAPGGSPTQDAAGNAVAALGGQVVSNTTPDTTAPAAPALALLASSDSGASNNDRITDIDTPTLRVTLAGSGATAPVAGDVVKIYLGATQVGTATLSAGDIASGHVDVTTSALGADGAKSLTATVTDAASNTSGASGALAITLDTTAPALSTASVDAATLVLTYDETLSGTTPAAADFAVSVNGVAVTPGAIVLDTVAKTLTLTLPSPAANGDVVTISYLPGATRTQDVAGNSAAALSARAVANATVAVVPAAPSPAPAAPSPAPAPTVIPIGRLSDANPPADPRPAPGETAPASDAQAAAPSRASLLGIGAELDPLRPVTPDSSRGSERAASRALELKLVDSGLTLPGERAFRIVVSKADEAALMVFHGIPDQDFSAEGELSFRIPADAFVHTRASAIITLRATLTDGRPLPKWLRFDPSTGKFDGEPPAGAPRLLSVLVTARDGDGREASTVFRIRFDAAETRREAGRASLSEQLRRVADRGLRLERTLDPARRARAD